MPKYIDVDLLLNDIKSWKAPAFRDIEFAIQTIFPIIVDAQPAAAVRSTKHGIWTFLNNDFKPYCSECMKDAPGRVLTDFCPNCGARMDANPDFSGVIVHSEEG